jgi:UDP-galactopyranose mutase
MDQVVGQALALYRDIQAAQAETTAATEIDAS